MVGQYATLLVELLLEMKREVCLEYEDIALIVLQLNSDEKILEFIDWVKSKMQGECFQATCAEILNMTAQIGRLTLGD